MNEPEWGCPACGSILDGGDPARPIIPDDIYEMFVDLAARQGET